jgi:hypothetical protein
MWLSSPIEMVVFCNYTPCSPSDDRPDKGNSKLLWNVGEHLPSAPPQKREVFTFVAIKTWHSPTPTTTAVSNSCDTNHLELRRLLDNRRPRSTPDSYSATLSILHHLRTPRCNRVYTRTRQGSAMMRTALTFCFSISFTFSNTQPGIPTDLLVFILNVAVVPRNSGLL